MFRRRNQTLEVLLVHPGGPFFRNEDLGAWMIPKGEALSGENLLERARIEFAEEMGVPAPTSEPIELGSIKQKGGKIVCAWAVKGDLDENFQLASNSFTLEWPPRSGRMSEFPEIDRAEFFSPAIAKQKINSAQAPFLERLNNLLSAHD